MQRLRIYFKKQEGARYLSHLDLQATLEYAFRRARLPLELSQGFHPRPRASLAAPLPVGYTGEHEILEMTLRDPLPPDQVLHRLQAALPQGITLTSAEAVPEGTRAAAARLRSATYRVQLPGPVADLSRRVDDLLRRPSLEVEENREGRVRKRDLRPQLLALRAAASHDRLTVEVRMDPNGTARPEQIVALLGLEPDGVQIARERIDLND